MNYTVYKKISSFVCSLNSIFKKVIPFFFIVVFCITSFTACVSNEDNEKPNVVIIFIDDMGFGDLSCYGDTLVKTPNMDALAQKGIKFTNFYVNSPICSPSRVALNT